MRSLRSMLLGFVLAILANQALGAGSTVQFGRFLDELKALFLEDGRKIQLLTDYRYEDPSREVWKAQKDFVSDGASIPRPLWSVVGSPLTGRYRNASVIHDYYCDAKSRNWRDTHRAFYFGMRANGVNAVQAKTMYYAGAPMRRQHGRAMRRQVVVREAAEDVRDLDHG